MRTCRFNLRIEILIIDSPVRPVRPAQHQESFNLRIEILIIDSETVTLPPITLTCFNLRIEILIIDSQMEAMAEGRLGSFNLRIEILIIDRDAIAVATADFLTVSISELRFLSLIEIVDANEKEVEAIEFQSQN